MTIRHLHRFTLALALVSATALATLAQAQPMGGMPGPRGAAMHGGHGMGHGMGPGMDGSPLLHGRLLDSVAATAEQKARVQGIAKAARDDVAKLREGQRDLHQQLMRALTAPTLDAAGAEALRQKLQAGHEAVSKRLLQAGLEAAAVLTPEQRQKLGERMSARRSLMERHQRERRALDPAS